MAIFCSISQDYVAIEFAVFVVGVKLVWWEKVIELFLTVFSLEEDDKLFH